MVQYDKMFDVIGQYDKGLSKFGQQQLVVENYASGFNQIILKGEIFWLNN